MQFLLYYLENALIRFLSLLLSFLLVNFISIANKIFFIIF